MVSFSNSSRGSMETRTGEVDLVVGSFGVFVLGWLAKAGLRLSHKLCV